MRKTVEKIASLLVVMTMVAFCLTGCGKKKTNVSSKVDEFKEIRGGWNSTSVGGSYWVFDEDNNFYWYKSSDDLNDNYYKGTMTILKGQEAIKDLGISDSQMETVTKNSEGRVTVDNIYSFHLKPTYLISGGVDKTNTLESSGELKMLFVYIDENSAQAMNMNNGDTFYLTKLDK